MGITGLNMKRTDTSHVSSDEKDLFLVFREPDLYRTAEVATSTPAPVRSNIHSIPRTTTTRQRLRTPCIETPGNWVFLTGDWAFKVRRKIQYGEAIDPAYAESSLREEFRLNKMITPEVYRDMWSLVLDQATGTLQLSADPQHPDAVWHAMRMAQFASDAVLDAIASNGAMANNDPKWIAKFVELGGTLAKAHRRANRLLLNP